MVIGKSLKRFRKDEDGAGLVWNLFWCVVFLLLAGLAIDVSNAYRMRMVLQVTADSAALAAIMTRDNEKYYNSFMAPDTPIVYDDTVTAAEREGYAKAVAIKNAQDMMAVASNGNVLVGADIEFGTYDRATNTFTVNTTGDYARAVTRRVSSRGNEVGTFLLRLFNLMPSWDVGATAIARRYIQSPCGPGVITTDKIDFQSNNLFTAGICLYGEKGIEANQNNEYSTGVIVGMLDLDDLTVPGDDLSKNIGLEEALREMYLSPHLALAAGDIVSELQNLASGSDLEGQLDLLQSMNKKYFPEAVQNAIADGDPTTGVVVDQVQTGVDKKTGTPIYGPLTNANFGDVVIVPGNVYKVACNGGNNTLNLRGMSEEENASIDGDVTGIIDTASSSGTETTTGGSSIDGVVVITDCDITVDDGTTIKNSIVATSSTSDMSVKGSNGVNIGAPDDCTPGGGAQIITLGGMHFAAAMQFHGSQLVSQGPVSIAAQVEGMSGTQIQSTGRVDMASNNDLGLCKGDTDDQIPLRYYRLVK